MRANADRARKEGRNDSEQTKLKTSKISHIDTIELPLVEIVPEYAAGSVKERSHNGKRNADNTHVFSTGYRS